MAHPGRPNSTVEPSHEPLTSSGPPEPLMASRRPAAASANTGPACGRNTSNSSPRRGSYRGTRATATMSCVARSGCPKGFVGMLGWQHRDNGGWRWRRRPTDFKARKQNARARQPTCPRTAAVASTKRPFSLKVARSAAAISRASRSTAASLRGTSPSAGLPRRSCRWRGRMAFMSNLRCRCSLSCSVEDKQTVLCRL
jgi:hypothetical protein